MQGCVPDAAELRQREHGRSGGPQPLRWRMRHARRATGWCPSAAHTICCTTIMTCSRKGSFSTHSNLPRQQAWLRLPLRRLLYPMLTFPRMLPTLFSCHLLNTTQASVSPTTAATGFAFHHCGILMAKTITHGVPHTSMNQMCRAHHQSRSQRLPLPAGPFRAGGGGASPHPSSSSTASQSAAVATGAGARSSCTGTSLYRCCCEMSCNSAEPAVTLPSCRPCGCRRRRMK